MSASTSLQKPPSVDAPAAGEPAPPGTSPPGLGSGAPVSGGSHGRRLWALLQVLLVLAALAGLDWKLSDGRAAGWERNTLRNALKRVDTASSATVAILGSSTSKDWLPERLVAEVMGVPTRAVLDAHINGCHQDCTWAEVRRLKAEGRRFDAVFIGTNLFQLCEFEHTKRILQQSWLLPLADLPALLTSYLHAARPLRPLGRLLGLTLSGAYGDATVVRRQLENGLKKVWNPEPKDGRRLPAWAWARRKGLPGAPPLSCTYTEQDVSLKLAYSAALLDDLAAVTDHVYLMLLPEVTLGIDEPEHRARWARHLAAHRALADARPHVQLVDLVHGGVRDRRQYRDGFHLNDKGIAAQQQLFRARVAALRAGASGGAKP